MSLAGKAVMINWSNVSADHRDEYYEWHDREHIAGRLRIPGFLRGRRHLAIDADRDVFNLYEVQTLQVLTSEPYTSKTNSPSAATKATAGFITEAIRALAHVRYSAGEGVGACVQTVRFDAAQDGAAALTSFLVDTALPGVAAAQGIVGVHLCVADAAASSVVSSERKGRPTSVPNWSIIVEGGTVKSVHQAVQKYLAPHHLADHGSSDAYSTGTYGLQVVMTCQDVNVK